MIFKQMQYFISIVKNNSFIEAAEENYISQSAISQAIKSLEDELGVTLLQRKNRGFTLTNAGEYFYKQSLLMVDEVANVAELLMTDKGAFITGADFLIDGGATASYFYGPLKPENN